MQATSNNIIIISGLYNNSEVLSTDYNILNETTFFVLVYLYLKLYQWELSQWRLDSMIQDAIVKELFVQMILFSIPLLSVRVVLIQPL